MLEFLVKYILNGNFNAFYRFPVEYGAQTQEKLYSSSPGVGGASDCHK